MPHKKSKSKPDKNHSNSTESVRIDRDVLSKARQIAKKEQRQLSAQLALLIQTGIRYYQEALKGA